MKTIKTEKLAQVQPMSQPQNPQLQQQMAQPQNPQLQQQMAQPYQQKNLKKMSPEESQALKQTLSLLRSNFPDLVPMLKNSTTRPYVIKILSAIADPDSLVSLRKILGKINQAMAADEATTERMLQQV